MHFRTAIISGVFACAATLPIAGTAFAQDRDCPSFATQPEAQAFFESRGGNDPHRLDRDDDGIACENRASGDSNGAVTPPSAAEPGEEGGQDQGVMPSGGVEAGHGGMADSAGDAAWQWWFIGSALLTASGVVVLRRGRAGATD